jgi:CBS domain-containing protein
VNVGERMTRDLATVSRNSSLREAAEQMCARRVGSLLVFDEERMLGILTERDVLKAVAGSGVERRVDECMTRDPETIGADETLEMAAVVMLHGGFRHLPVSDGERVVGMLSMRDLMSVVAGDQVPRGV